MQAHRSRRRASDEQWRRSRGDCDQGGAPPGERVKGVASPEIIVAEGNFHGRTTTVISFSSEPDYRDGFGPFTPGFRLVPFGDLEATRAAISERTVAILVEPIQGEAGVIVPPRGWLAGLRRLCDEKHILLLLDEI